jgi:hypothetical protein
MPSLILKIDGTHVVTWHGDEAETRELECAFHEACADSGYPPEAVARTAVLNFSGLSNDPSVQLGQMMALTYFALWLDTGDALRPGQFRDYLPLRDYEIDVRREAGGQLELRVTESRRRG